MARKKHINICGKQSWENYVLLMAREMQNNDPKCAKLYRNVQLEFENEVHLILHIRSECGFSDTSNEWKNK